MKKINFKKDKISIKNIGKQRFWFGIISGFISAISISLIFNRVREVIRFLTSISEDLLTFENNELIFFNYFFVSLATVLGLSITIWVWMGNPINEKKKHKIYKQQVRTNVQLFFWLILFLTAQLGCLFLFLIYGECSNYFDVPVNLYKDHSILFILAPIVIFLQNWFFVRRIYRAGKWMLVSLIISILTIFILNKTTTIDQNVLNNAYFKRHQVSQKYIENIISKSEKEYNIQFDNKDIEALKKRKSLSANRQIWNTKRGFSVNKKTTLSNIIIHKVIIHNLKKSNRYRYHGESRTLVNWEYALPKDILKQINYFETHSNETKELFEVLKEQILLVNKSKIILDDYKKFDEITSKKERLEPKVNIMLVEQLIDVRDSLLSLEKYSSLNRKLSEIKKLPQ
ncbi:hypothetical protein [Tenacibaculum sp. 190524A02b]|uniref:hypothetical protein n=1 Tax=Tenacibaculum vairaonense TaxID=3137860 RepID=UPI0031FAD8D2